MVATKVVGAIGAVGSVKSWREIMRPTPQFLRLRCMREEAVQLCGGTGDVGSFVHLMWMWDTCSEAAGGGRQRWRQIVGSTRLPAKLVLLTCLGNTCNIVARSNQQYWRPSRVKYLHRL